MEFTNDLISAVNEIVTDSKWQKIGPIDEFLGKDNILLYPDITEDEEQTQIDNIVLFCIGPSEFYAIDCACPHEGGPLELGDIEDTGNEGLAIICPWHSYDFNLKDGTSSTGLKTNVYETRTANGDLYIKCGHVISLTNTKDQVKVKKAQENEEEETIQKLEQLQTKDEKEADSPTECLCGIAKDVLNTSDPMKKSELTRAHYANWLKKRLSVGYAQMPDQPKRQEGLQIKDPGRIKRGKGGTLESRIAMIHSLANIEQWAIDLSWDVMGRFSTVKINDKPLPMEFFDDFIKVADDEAKHFAMLNERLEILGSFFGALPVHNGLWQSAEETSYDLLARLAIVHMVHEARGLDVHPKTKQRFGAQKDEDSVALMDVIYRDEITHVACGMKWFTWLCKNMNPSLEPVETFHKLVKKHFKGYLKPPFNTEGRLIAGMTEEWYTPLVKK